MSIERFAILAVLALTMACRDRDPCERAIERLARLNASPPKGALDLCRHGKYAQYDPVLRCAMDADSDEAAATCIDQFVHSVVKPDAHNRTGSGLNPLRAP